MTQAELPAGDYAIVELMGHTTLVGRISEVERFGTKMLCIEPMFNGALLEPVFQGGPSIYRLTPCTMEVAIKEQPKRDYLLPPSIRVTVPAALLAAPQSLSEVVGDLLDLDEGGGGAVK